MSLHLNLRRSLTASLAVCALLPAAATAQTQAADQPSPLDGTPILRMSVPLVVLDAVVSDRHTRQPVPGLSAKDFVLKEDDKLQTISYFAQNRVPLSIVFMIDLTETVKPVRSSLAAAAKEILSHLGDADEVAVAVFSSTGKVILPFTTDRSKARTALERAGKMSSNEGTFLNEAVYLVTAQLMSKASVGNRKALICLTDGTVNIPSVQEQQAIGRSTLGISLHTEEQAKLALLQQGVAFNAIIEKSPLSYLVEVSRHPKPADIKQYPPGNAKTFASLTGGIVLESGRSSGAATLELLLDDLRARYTLGYRPSQEMPENSFCHIQLTLTPEALQSTGHANVETRAGYYR